MNKQDALKIKREKLLKRLGQDPKGVALLEARKNKGQGVETYMEVVKQVSWLIGKIGANFDEVSEKTDARIASMSRDFASEVAKVEKALKAISDGNKDEQTIAELKDLKTALKALAAKELPAPVVNVAPPQVNVQAPEAKVINETKTEVVLETKYQEAAAKTLENLMSVLEKVANNTKAIGATRVSNSMSDAIPVQIVDKKGRTIMDFSDVPKYLTGASGGGTTQYKEGDTVPTIVGTVVMWEDASDVVRPASVAKPLPTQISDGTRTVTVRDTGSNDSLNVSIVDASGNQIVTFGGTTYTEDSAATGGESLTLAGVVRQDTLATSTSANGDYAYLKTNSAGALWVSLLSTTCGGATAKTADFDTSGGTDTVQMFGIALPSATGAAAGGTATNPLGVQMVAPITALTASSPATYTVTTSSAQAIASNASRKGLHIVNVGNGWTYLGIGATAVLSSGIALAPNGGSYEMVDRYLTTSAINAIGAFASTLSIQEWT